jgi:hypothetical protein
MVVLCREELLRKGCRIIEVVQWLRLIRIDEAVEVLLLHEDGIAKVRNQQEAEDPPSGEEVLLIEEEEEVEEEAEEVVEEAVAVVVFEVQWIIIDRKEMLHKVSPTLRSVVGETEQMIKVRLWEEWRRLVEEEEVEEQELLSEETTDGMSALQEKEILEETTRNLSLEMVKGRRGLPKKHRKRRNLDLLLIWRMIANISWPFICQQTAAIFVLG